MYGLSAIVLLAVRWVNIRENKRRDRVQAEEGVNLDDETRRAIGRFRFMDLTDFEQTYFRYVKLFLAYRLQIEILLLLFPQTHCESKYSLNSSF